LPGELEYPEHPEAPQERRAAAVADCLRADRHDEHDQVEHVPPVPEELPVAQPEQFHAHLQCEHPRKHPPRVERQASVGPGLVLVLRRQDDQVGRDRGRERAVEVGVRDQAEEEGAQRARVAALGGRPQRGVRAHLLGRLLGLDPLLLHVGQALDLLVFLDVAEAFDDDTWEGMMGKGVGRKTETARDGPGQAAPGTDCGVQGLFCCCHRVSLFLLPSWLSRTKGPSINLFSLLWYGIPRSDT
jgi:hypothetical protein